MTQDLSITALVLQASLVVQIVMAGLALTSLASWTVIFGKLFGLKRVRIGKVKLGELPTGQWRYLLPEEIF